MSNLRKDHRRSYYGPSNDTKAQQVNERAFDVTSIFSAANSIVSPFGDLCAEPDPCEECPPPTMLSIAVLYIGYQIDNSGDPSTLDGQPVFTYPTGYYSNSDGASWLIAYSEPLEIQEAGANSYQFPIPGVDPPTSGRRFVWRAFQGLTSWYQSEEERPEALYTTNANGIPQIQAWLLYADTADVLSGDLGLKTVLDTSYNFGNWPRHTRTLSTNLDILSNTSESEYPPYGTVQQNS